MELTLTLMVGVSGSGKSTHAAKIASATGATIVEPDAIRKELTGDATDQSQNDQVFALAFQRAESLLRRDQSVIVDATNVDRNARSNWISIGNRCAARIVAAVVDTPVSTAKKRNLARSRVVPDFVIDKQAKRLQHPTLFEGFDEIIVVS